MPSGRGLAVWLLVAVVLWSSCGCITTGVNTVAAAVPQQHQVVNQNRASEDRGLIPNSNHQPKIYLPNIKYLGLIKPAKRNLLLQNFNRQRLSSPYKKSADGPIVRRLEGEPRKRFFPTLSAKDESRGKRLQGSGHPETDPGETGQGQGPQLHAGAFENVFGPWLKNAKRFDGYILRPAEPELRRIDSSYDDNASGDNDAGNELIEEDGVDRFQAEDQDEEGAAFDEGHENGISLVGDEEEKARGDISKSLKEVGKSATQTFVRKARGSSTRAWDVPQIGESLYLSITHPFLNRQHHFPMHLIVS